jgi:tetratricopeptide (TPR) repeat protein
VTPARWLPVLLVLAAALPACGPTGVKPTPTADLAPGERPARGSDEAGLWMSVDKIEEQVRISPLLVKAPALDAYVRGVVCRLAGPQCDGLRVYVVRYAEPYAGVAPNGMLLLGTGLFLRLGSEAQLAHFLGHEVAHYRRRHSAQRWSQIKAKAIPNFGANLMLEIPGLLAFSRDNEREADRVGFELAVAAGYAPLEAVRAWERFAAERSAGNASATTAIRSTHPPDAERLEALRTLAASAPAPPDPRIGREEYAAAVRPLRHQLLADEVARGQFAASDVVLRRLLEEPGGLGDLYFHLGEIHRRRGESDDLPKAVADYRRALEHDDAPPETYRSLGLVHLRLGDRPAARDALARYHERLPQAPDRELIRTQISELDRAR